MKLYSKLSALGAVLMLTTAFASADTINFGSGSGSVGYFGYSTTATGAPVIQAGGVNNTPTTGCSATVCQVYTVSPGGIWAAPFAGTTWVSYDPNSGPGETEPVFDANGFYTYATNFTTTGGGWGGSVTVAADDTVAVFLNGVQISNFGTIGGDTMCADGPPNCRDGQSSTITLGSSLPEFNNDGFNLLEFVVDQSGSHNQGLDYVGTLTSTPEPNTLILLGTGLLGSAGALFRKMRANA
jgi:PEP-CTERM motif